MYSVVRYTHTHTECIIISSTIKECVDMIILEHINRLTCTCFFHVCIGSSYLTMTHNIDTLTSHINTCTSLHVSVEFQNYYSVEIYFLIQRYLDLENLKYKCYYCMFVSLFLHYLDCFCGCGMVVLQRVSELIIFF